MNSQVARRMRVGCCLCGLVAAVAGAQNALAIGNLKVGDPMPAFSLARADGGAGTYGSEQLKGQPGIVMFWRPGQRLSANALEDLQQIVQQIGASKVRILAVDTARSSAQGVQAALAGKKPPFPILLDPQRELYGKVGVIVCPTTLLLDGQGVLRFVVASRPRQFSQVVRARLQFLLGEIDEEQMKREIEPTVLKIEHDLAAGWRMYNLGRKLQAEGKSDQAVAVYEKAVSEHPSLPEARCALGFMQLAAGNLQAAGEQFQSALVHQPASATARLGRAAVLARTGQPQEAEQILLSLLSQKAVTVRVRYELGRIYHARGELDKAVIYFQDALATMFPEPKALSPTPTPPATTSRPAGTDPDATVTPRPAAPNATPSGQTVQPIVPPADAQYVGLKPCKKCHLQQWKSWQETKMANTFEALEAGKRTDVKASRNLDPQKDYTKDTQCLGCHSTGFGHAGGYRTPAPNDARAARAAEQHRGVACESCHGPGNKYSVIHKDVQDKKRQYAQAEFFDSGQYPVDARVCAACHQDKAPCIESGYVFEFEKRKEEGTHKHYDLQFQTE